MSVRELHHNSSGETLLDLDGQVFVVDAKGAYWVRFVVRRVEPSAERPHGLEYSLTLHDSSGRRLVGFDNAHPVRAARGPGGRGKGPHDHKHRLKTTRMYQYQDGATLLADFWREVDSVLKEKGVLS